MLVRGRLASTLQYILPKHPKHSKTHLHFVNIYHISLTNEDILHSPFHLNGRPQFTPHLTATLTKSILHEHLEEIQKIQLEMDEVREVVQK